MATRKKIQQLYVEMRLASRLSYRLLATFLPKKQHLSPQQSALWTDTSVNFPPGKQPPSLWVRGSDSDLFTDGDYVIMSFRAKNVNSSSLTEGHCGSTLKTHTSSWRVPSHLFRSCSAGFLCDLHSGSSSLQRCFALCERPTAENWRTTAVVLMHVSVKGATYRS